jgi:hypothetical protein
MCTTLLRATTNCALFFLITLWCLFHSEIIYLIFSPPMHVLHKEKEKMKEVQLCFIVSFYFQLVLFVIQPGVSVIMVPPIDSTR